jgi:hypothetical protein
MNSFWTNFSVALVRDRGALDHESPKSLLVVSDHRRVEFRVRGKAILFLD